MTDVEIGTPPADLAGVKSEISRLRVLAQNCSVTDAAAWTRDQKAAFDAETRWCVDAPQELVASIAAARS